MPHTNLYIKKLVIKLGTKVLAPDGQLEQNVFNQVSWQVMEAQKLGVEVTIVSSAGILAGRERAQKLNLNVASLKKRYLAGIGARHLLNRWGQAFEKHGREIAQIWISHGNLRDAEEKKSIQYAIRDYHIHGIIPIVNENDVVSDTEVHSMEYRISENDLLAEKLAGEIGADSILFLTNVGGVYEENPSLESGARRFAEINVATAEKLASLSSGTAENGTGGMSPKLRAAVRCYHEKNMKACIASVSDNAIPKFIKGEKVGTLIGTSVHFW